MTLKPNAEELALIAQAMGAGVIRGPVRYPSEMGDIAVGRVDIAEYLHESKGQEVMLVVAPLVPMEELPVIYGHCGTPYNDDECPGRRAEREDAKGVIEQRLRSAREETDSLIGDLEEWLEEANGYRPPCCSWLAEVVETHRDAVAGWRSRTRTVSCG